MSLAKRELGSNLAEIPFSDLQLQLTGDESAYYQSASAGAQRQQVMIVPEIYRPRLHRLKGALEEFGKDSGTLEFDEMRLRFQISATDGDQLYVILRRLAGQIGELESLGISPKAINIFSQFTKLRSGMIIVLGGTAQGKTTLAAHIYKRMVGTTGGRGITIQDPVEYATQGPIGKGGFSLDFPVIDNDWARPLFRALRSNPAYLFIGEILTPQAAAMAISAAATDVMVITTVHGRSIGEGLSRLTDLAAGTPTSGSMDFYRTQISRSLISVIKTQLSPFGPDLMVLFGENPNDRDEIGKIIATTAERVLSTTQAGWTKEFNAPRPNKA